MTTPPAANPSPDVSYLERDGKPDLAYVYTPPSNDGEKLPLVMFCGGYRADMTGTKATYFETQCAARGQAYLRFDYSGHGVSQGRFEDGTIGGWAEDARDILDHIARGPVVLVGSSMGGWIALLVARARSGVVQGLIGIAAAPDFTEDLFERLSPAQREELMNEGELKVPNDYSDEQYHYTKQFYEEAKDHMLLTKKQNIDFPVCLIQGMQDNDVPWETAVKIQKNYAGSEVDIVFVDDGDHRLSRPEDLELIYREIANMSDGVGA